MIFTVLVAIWNCGTGLGVPAVRGKLSKMFSKEEQGIKLSFLFQALLERFSSMGAPPLQILLTVDVNMPTSIKDLVKSKGILYIQ